MTETALDRAPPPEDPTLRGTNQSGMRAQNERLVLTLLRKQGALAKSDIARITGLSAQTVSVIMRALERDGLLSRGEPQRGRVGKPSTPMTLAATGAYAVGLKIGRRTSDLVLIDLLGQVRFEARITYRYPLPEAIFAFLRNGLAQMEAQLGAAASRIAGIGIAKPGELWNWHNAVGAPEEELTVWRGFDFEAEIARFTPLPVFVENDATAAARAEQVYGKGREHRDFAHFFVGSFIGGGMVLNHSVFDGVQGNAAAFGSLPSALPGGGAGQLIDTASIFLLERRMVQAGIDPGMLWVEPQDWSGFAPVVTEWVHNAAESLAAAVLTVCAVIDFDTVLIDGAFPPAVRSELVAATQGALGRLDSRGLRVPGLEEGSIGANARALGGATSAIFARYLLNTHPVFSG